MRQSVIILAGAALALPLAACQDRTQPAQADPSVAMQADAEAVKTLENAFIAGWKAKDPAVKALYAADAVMMVPNAPPNRGAAAIAASFARYAADPAAAFDATNATTVVSAGGDLAYSQGNYTTRFTDPGTKAVDSTQGYYLLVYKKQRDGSWKVVQDVSSPLP